MFTGRSHLTALYRVYGSSQRLSCVSWNPPSKCCGIQPQAGQRHYNSVLTNHPFTRSYKPIKISVACSPQANYTDRATAACRRSWCQLLQIEGVTWSAQRFPTVVNIGFLDRSRIFLEIAPQLSSRGWVDLVPDPLLLRKPARAGNRTRDLCICSQEFWPLDHRGGHLQAYSVK
jgi:hypothetical protein